LNPSYKLGKRFFTGVKNEIENAYFQRYLSLRSIEGISKSWLSQIKLYLGYFLKFVDWKIDEDKTIQYCKHLSDNYSTTYYRKQIFQVRRFLDYLKVEWAKEIRLPPEPCYTPKRITKEDILTTLSYFENHEYYLQIRALILLGTTSGMRAEELYQLAPDDIDLENRTVSINHNPSKGQTTKTGKSRVSFFNKETLQALNEYFDYFNNGSELKNLFTQSHITRIFKDSDVKVKDLRKFFSQEWDRKGGSTGIKKILMGHSGDVDLYHYNAQNEEDLKKMYDKVRIEIK